MSEENNPADEQSVEVSAETPMAENDNLDRAMENQPEVELSEVDQLKAELADAEKRALMAQADLDNFRKRNRREMLDQVKYASLKLMNELLESVDNLQRAVDAYQQEPNGDGLAAGVAMVSSQISKVLESHGCKKIEAVGSPFDPNLHQALQMQPSDEHPENTVMMDLRSGFVLHDRLIRPAQVFVSTGAVKEN